MIERAKKLEESKTIENGGRRASVSGGSHHKKNGGQTRPQANQSQIYSALNCIIGGPASGLLD